MHKIDFRGCKITAMFFLHIPYNLLTIQSLFYAQYPKFLLLESFFRWLLPAGLSDCEIKIINFFLQTCRDFCIFCTVRGYIRSRYNYNTLYRTQQSFLKIWLLFVLTLLEIKSLTKSSSNDVVNFHIHYYLRE